MRSVHEILTSVEIVEHSSLAALLRDVLRPSSHSAKVIVLDEAVRARARDLRAQASASLSNATVA